MAYEFIEDIEDEGGIVMKSKKILAILLSLALLVPFAVPKPAQAVENLSGLYQMDCDEEYVRHNHRIAQDNFIVALHQSNDELSGDVFFSNGERAGKIEKAKIGMYNFIDSKMVIQLRNGVTHEVPVTVGLKNNQKGKMNLGLFDYSGYRKDGGPLRPLGSMDEAIEVAPNNPRSGGSGIMNGTWFIGTSEGNADQKMFIEQNGDGFTGTYNFTNIANNIWEQGTITGIVNGNIVEMNIQGTSWNKNGSVHKDISCSGQFKYDAQEKTLEPIAPSNKKDPFAQWIFGSMFVKYANFIESPRYSSLNQVFPGAPSVSYSAGSAVQPTPQQPPVVEPAPKPVDKPTPTSQSGAESITVLTIGSTTLLRTANGTVTTKTLDVAPYINAGQNRTMLPLRAVGEILGLNVKWDDASRVVIVSGNGVNATVPVDRKVIIVDGKTLNVDAAAEIKNGRTMMSIANLGTALGLERDKNIIWDGAARTVTIVV